jgi:hypothetical protein
LCGTLNAGNRFVRDGNEPGPQLGENNYPEGGLVKPRDVTKYPSAQLGAAPPSGAEEQTARAISACAWFACLPPLQIGSIN